MKKTLLMAIAILFIVFGCSKNKQILNKIYGQHAVASYTVNGVDSVSLLKDSLPVIFEFYYSDDNKCIWNINGYNETGGYVQININWTLEEEKKLIVRGVGTLNIGTGPFGREKKPVWEITELNNKHFNMKTNFNGKEYIIEMN